MPTLPARTAGTRKSNIPILARPMSAAMDTTSRLVEVPMVVVIPPSSVENPMGIIFDPEEAMARYEAGEPAAQIVKRPKLPEGMTPWDMLRT